MAKPDAAVLWPNEEKYPAFATLCGGTAVATYRDFVARAQPIVDEMRAKGFNVVLVDPDLEHMAAWCRARFGNIDSKARTRYAAWVVLNEPTDTDSIN